MNLLLRRFTVVMIIGMVTVLFQVGLALDNEITMVSDEESQDYSFVTITLDMNELQDGFSLGINELALLFSPNNDLDNVANILSQEVASQTFNQFCVQSINQRVIVTLTKKLVKLR